MQTWPVQDAKARFSEFLEACISEGPQMVTKRGAETTVLVSVDVWRRLQDAARPSLEYSMARSPHPGYRGTCSKSIGQISCLTPFPS